MATGIDDEEIDMLLLTLVKCEVAEMMVASHDAYAKTWEDWATEFRYVGEDDPAAQIASEEELDQSMPGGRHAAEASQEVARQRAAESRLEDEQAYGGP